MLLIYRFLNNKPKYDSYLLSKRIVRKRALKKKQAKQRDRGELDIHCELCRYEVEVYL